jgi:hypothetical protein
MLEYKKDTKIYKISYLLLADTIERLDMILLELRHLQRNIIYSMREPGFNALLRFEEDFLWGQGWDELFKRYTVENEDSVIDEHILHYPAPDNLVEFSAECRIKSGYLIHQDTHIEPYYNIKEIREKLLPSLQLIITGKENEKKRQDKKESFYDFHDDDLKKIEKIILDIQPTTKVQNNGIDSVERKIPFLIRNNLYSILNILDILTPSKAETLGFSKERINNIREMVLDFLDILSNETELKELQKEHNRKAAKKIFKEMKPILIRINLNNLVYHLWNKTGWRISYKRHYGNLRGTQLLKKMIVRDKFKLCRFALTHAGIVAGKKDKADMDQGALARFIILRSAIHTRCTQYLERIMAYQSLFSKVLDIGVKEFPMPSTERRREIGIYMDFLNDRVNRIHDETTHLVERLRVSTPQKDKDESKDDDSSERPIILHSWKHHFTAEHQVQEDAIGRSPHTVKRRCDLHHITTSYWMPERMDLQPIIGHEAAHLALHQHFDNLSDLFLQHSQANFVDLQRNLLRVLNHYDRILGIGELSPAHKPHALLREISCDFLAASVKGFSYLYALLLESIGIGLDKFLLYGNFNSGMESADLIDLDVIYALKGTGGHPMTTRRDWWLRLKLVIFWLKRIHHWQPSGLDLILLEGTDSLLDNLLVFFDRITLQSEDRKGELWNALFQRLSDEIEISPAVREVRQWRTDRSRYTEQKETEGQDDDFLSSILRFSEQVRDALKKIHMGMKMKEGNALFHSISENNNLTITECFNRDYFLDTPFSYTEEEIVFSKNSGHRGFEEDENETEDESRKRENLHGYLYDIPWTCAMTRTIDLFGHDDDLLARKAQIDGQYPEKKVSWLDHVKDISVKKTLTALSEDNPLGRELYSLALEFHMVSAENPLDRLVHIRHLFRTHDNIRGIIKRIIKEKKSFPEWKTHRDFWKNWKSRINDILKEKNQEEAEKSMGQALVLAEAIFKEIRDRDGGGPNDKKLNKEQAMFLSVINYLNFYKQDNTEISITEEIINSTTSLDEHGECYLYRKNIYIRCLRMIIVSRYAIGGYYSMQSKSEYDAFTDHEKLTPVKMLGGDTYWSRSTETQTNNRERKEGKKLDKETKCNKYPFKITQYSNVLGRYDALSFTRTRPLCRCSLPHLRPDSLPYQFTSSLTRREFGIRIDLNTEKKCTAHLNRDKEKEHGFGLVGAISIILKRRALRMPFLARLLASAQKKPIGAIEQEKDLIGRFLKNDRDTALLLDGSVDILLVFCADYNKQNDPKEKKVIERVEDVLDSAYWLFQDFMVERTEIIFDAITLDYVAKEIVSNLEDKIRPESEFSIECKIRFFEDQFLDYSLEEFRNGLFQKIDKSQEISEQDRKSFTVITDLTPGRMDMTLRLFPPAFLTDTPRQNDGSKYRGEWFFELKEGGEETFRDRLIELLEPENRKTSYIDRVEISINKQPPTFQ